MKARDRLLAGALALGLAALSCFPLPCRGGIIRPLTAAAETEEETAQRLQYANTIACLVNDHRASCGLRELMLLPDLTDLAQIRAEEMAVYCNRKRPGDVDWDTVLTENGFRYSYAAQNIAAGSNTPTGTFGQFMRSEGHRLNLEGENFTHIGIGYRYDPNAGRYYYFWAMILAVCVDGAGQPDVREGEYYPTRARGDANADTVINAADATYILTHASELAVGVSVGTSKGLRESADLNGDGRVDAVDASALLTYIAAAGVDPNVTIDSFVW